MTALDAEVERNPNGTALVWKSRILTWGYLRDLVHAQAGAWYSWGLRTGDRVAVLVPPGSALPEVILSLFYGGFVAVLAEPTGSHRFLLQSFEDAQIRGFVGVRRAHLLRLMKRFPKSARVYVVTNGPVAPGEHSWRHAARVRPLRQPVDVADHDPILMTFTTGTTGRPKGVGRSFAFLELQQELLARELQLTPETVAMSALPTFVLSLLSAGCTAVLPSIPSGGLQKVRYDRISRQIEANNVELLLAAPYFCERLADEVERRGRELPTLTRIVTGGGPVTPRVVDRLRRAFPNTAVTALYGSSEAEPIALISAEKLVAHRREIQSGMGIPVGAPIPEIEVLVIRAGAPDLDFRRDDRREWLVTPGSIGEIVVRGAHVNDRYLQNVDAERRLKIPDEGGTWHRTGDSGYRDERGTIWLCGPVSQRLLWSGTTVYPWSVEAGLCERFADADFAVVSSGSAVPVVVVGGPGRGGVLRDGRLDLALDELGLHGLPTRSLRSIPKDPRHRTKVDRRLLRRKLGYRKAGLDR